MSHYVFCCHAILGKYFIKFEHILLQGCRHLHVIKNVTFKNTIKRDFAEKKVAFYAVNIPIKCDL